MPVQVPQHILDAIEQVESGGRGAATPDSSKGAIGPMQVTPSTGADLGYSEAQLRNPDTNREAGAKYFQQMADRYDGNLHLAAMAYDGGPGRVDAWLRGEGDLPQETIDYARKFADAAGLNFKSAADAQSSQLNDQQSAHANAFVSQLLQAHPELKAPDEIQTGSLAPTTPGGIPPMTFTRGGGPISPGNPQIEAPKTGVIDNLVQWAREQGLEPDSSLPPAQQIQQMAQKAMDIVVRAGVSGEGGEGEPPEGAAAAPEVPRATEGAPVPETPSAGAPGGAAPTVLPPSAAEVPHSIPEMTEVARATPMTPEQFNSIELSGDGDHSLIKYPIDAMDLLRMHQYAIAKGYDFARAADLALKSGAPEDIARVQALGDEIRDTVAPRFEAAWHQQGLGLRMGREVSSESGYMRDLGAVLKQDQPMAQLLKAVNELPTKAARDELLRQAAAGGSKGIVNNLLAYYVESMLSFNTVVKKMSTDAFMATWAFPERFVAEQFSRVGRALGASPESTIAPGETHAMMVGLKDGIGDAVKLASIAAREDRNPLDPAIWGGVGWGDASHEGGPALSSTGTRFEDTPIGAGIDLYGHFIHLPARGILTTDVFAKAVNQQMSLRALCYREAYWQTVSQGLEGDEFGEALEDAYDNILAKPPPGLVQQSIDEAKLQTMSQALNIHPDEPYSLGFAAEKLNDARQSSLVKAIVPFWPTLVNLSRRSLEFSGPLGLLSRTARDALVSGGPQAYTMMSRMALSSLILTGLWEHLHGSAPANPQVKQLWQDQGNQQYSIGAGNFDIGNLPEPVSGASQYAADVKELGVGPQFFKTLADIKELSARASADDASKLGVAAVMLMTREMDNSTSLKNLTSLLHILTSGGQEAQKAVTQGKMAEEQTPEQQEAQESLAQNKQDTTIEAINKALRQYAGTIVPSSIANLAHAIDPVTRQVNGLVDEVRSRVPGWSFTLQPEYDLYGRPAVTPLGWNRYTGNQISLFRVAEHKSDPVVKQLDTLGVTIPVLGSDGLLTLGDTGYTEKVPVNPQQVARVNQLRGTVKNDEGNDLHQAWQADIDSKDFKEAMDPNDRRKMLMNTVAGFTALAKAKLMEEDKSLVQSYSAIASERGKLKGASPAGGVANISAP